MSAEVAEHYTTAEGLKEAAESIRDRLKEAHDAENQALLEARELTDLLERNGHMAFKRYSNEMTDMTKFLVACLDPDVADESTPELNRREIQDVIDLMAFALKGRGDA